MSAIKKLPAVITDKNVLDFESLVNLISQVHKQLATEAVKAVNIYLTLRNWLIGHYIREYELKGSDRAKYGQKLFEALAQELMAHEVSNCSRRQLYRYRDFFLAYPGIVGTLSPQSGYSIRDLINRLSYSHFEELTALEDPLKRAFCLQVSARVAEEGGDPKVLGRTIEVRED